MAPGAPDDPYALFSDDLLGMAAGVGGAEEEDDLRNRVLNGADDDAGDGARARHVHHHLHGGHQQQPQQPHPPRSRYPDPAPLGGGGNGRGRGGNGGGRYDESEFFHDALHGGATFGDHLDGALGVDAGPIDELDGDDEIEQQEWPSPAELLADTKAMLATADDLIKRDGKNPPPEAMRRLDARLRAIVASQKTTPRDDQKRQTLLRRFADMLRRKFPGVTLRPFGSFVSVFHTASSDIDISLEVAPSSKWYDPKEMGPAAAAAAPGARGAGRNRRLQQPRGYKSRKVQLLHKVASELRYQAFSEVNLIAHARVPLIKFKDPQTGVNCDVCVGNDGVYKSACLGAMANLDSRYRDLVFLVKMWAKNFDCNDATAGSFNSFALSLMSLFHLQTRSPPILPPAMRLTLQNDAAADADLAAENERAANLEPIRKFPVSKIRQQSDALRDIGPVEQRARRWENCGAANDATLAELLVTFFTHFRAVEPLWRHGLVASAYAGRWVAGSAWAPGRYCLGVEDPFAAGDNVARAVQRRSLPKVLAAIRDGTLAMARVAWAETDEDLERALFNLLGPGASPEREMTNAGWPTLGGSGGGDALAPPTLGGGPGPGPGPGHGHGPPPPPGPPPGGGGGAMGLFGGGGGGGGLGGPPGIMPGDGIMPGMMHQLVSRQRATDMANARSVNMMMGDGGGGGGGGGIDASMFGGVLGGAFAAQQRQQQQQQAHHQMQMQQQMQQRAAAPQGFGVGGGGVMGPGPGLALGGFAPRGPSDGSGGNPNGFGLLNLSSGDVRPPPGGGMQFAGMPSLFGGANPNSGGTNQDSVDELFARMNVASPPRDPPRDHPRGATVNPFDRVDLNAPRDANAPPRPPLVFDSYDNGGGRGGGNEYDAPAPHGGGGRSQGGGGSNAGSAGGGGGGGGGDAKAGGGGGGRRGRNRGGGGKGGSRGGGGGSRGGGGGGGGSGGGGGGAPSGAPKALPKPRVAPPAS